MYPIQHRKYRPGIDNLLVLLIGGIPIAMPTVLSVTMAIGSHRLAQQVGSNGCSGLIGRLIDHSFMAKCRTAYYFKIIAGSYHKKDDSNRRNGWDGCALQ